MKTHRLIVTPTLALAALTFAVSLPAHAQEQPRPPNEPAIERPSDISPPLNDLSTSDRAPTPRTRTDVPPVTSDPANPSAPQESSTPITPPEEQSLATRAPEPPHTSATATASSEAVQVASPDAKDRGLRRYAGLEVRTDGGERLGTLKDFVIDAASGKIAYAVVSSGGVLGAGDTLRAVPANAVQRSTAIDGFVIHIDPARWTDVPALSEDDFDSGRVSISTDQQRRLHELFETEPAAIELAATSSDSMQLQRASEIRGKAIQSGQQNVGDIEEIVIDLDRGTAAALVAPTNEFTAADADYLVPIQRLNLASDDGVATTTLSETDFEQAPSSRQNLASAARQSPVRSPIDNEQLSPTGRSNKEQAPELDVGLAESARTVRKALDQDAALSSANVQVLPESGKLVLRGSVRDQDTKMSIERAARDAAVEATIENQITINSRER